MENKIFALRTTANREDQVLDFVTGNVQKKQLEVYSIIRPHGLRGYIFVEAKSREDVEEAFKGIPYARGLLPNEVDYKEIEHMLEQIKREKAKISRVDLQKEEVVVELLETAVPIPITVKLDAVKVIRRDTEEEIRE